MREWKASPLTERNFLEKFKKLSLVSTAIPKPKKEAKVETKAAYTDGFGA